ncbi:hypothetical protein OG497_37855 [Streptomyces sp. NBC_01242]|uniref:hypothetical protein n=1 Tax=Streptomyces sp. NBC_01242 TaxID=2903795 RepID=UPI002252C6E3|nr:hypothetical protein [Streptomyces sp. NBC_01242]MCX4799624.1 hypothetical protein [Streptomyces sp. NBC_01242]
MSEQQTTGITNADEMIETARAAGLTVDVKKTTGDGYIGYLVRIGYVVPEYAKGTALGQVIECDWLALNWYKSDRKGSRGKLLSARWNQLTGDRELKTLKRAAAHVDYMAKEAAEYAEQQAEEEAQQQRGAAPVVVEPEPVKAPEGLKVKRGDMVMVALRPTYAVQSPGDRVRAETVTEWQLMTVTGLTRDGAIRMVRDDRYGGAAYPVKFDGMLHATGAYKLLPASMWDLGRVLDAAKGHTYPKSTTPRCFESMEQARELLAGARLVRDGERVVARADIDAGRVVVEEQQPEERAAVERPGTPVAHLAADSALVRGLPLDMQPGAVSAPELPTGEAFEFAVKTARAAVPIMQRVTRPEAWCGYVIVRAPVGRYGVYSEDAWTEPTERPLLPWSAPVGERVAVVALDGTVTPWEALSAPVSAEERPGGVLVPVASVEPCESIQGAASGLLDDEERAAVLAERLTPCGERLALRVVQSMDERATVEERAFVVGLVATQLRAGARHSATRGGLVLRWEGVTTVVSLAA